MTGYFSLAPIAATSFFVAAEAKRGRNKKDIAESGKLLLKK